jgi:hypothetical protein
MPGFKLSRSAHSRRRVAHSVNAAIGERPRSHMDNLTAIAILCVVAAAIWWWLRRGSRAAGAESQLRRICLGNAEQMERLISGEMARTPGISRAEAADRAVLRYQRDNH